jgi:hypothetical protein
LCHRPAPSGGTCTTKAIAGTSFCKGHTCPECGASKSGKAKTCPSHENESILPSNPNVGDRQRSATESHRKTNDRHGTVGSIGSSSAPPGQRERSATETSTKCAHVSASSGKKCVNVALAASGRCSKHTCKTVGCNTAKLTTDEYCSTHA